MISIYNWLFWILVVFGGIGAIVTLVFIVSLVHDVVSYFYWGNKFKEWNKHDGKDN